MTAAARTPKPVDRRAMTAKIHIARKDLALGDDSYRSLLERITGKTTSKDCSDRQLHAVLEEFRRLGWKPKARPAAAARAARTPRPIATDEQAAKVRAMWLSLWCLGAIDNPAEEALESYVARMTKSPGNPDGIARLQWLDAAGYDRVIRALRGWCQRVGFPQPTAADVDRINRMRERTTLGPASYGLVCKVMLFRALWNRLERAGAFRHGVLTRQDDFVRQHQPAVVAPEFMADAPIDAACRDLGGWLRRVGAKGAK